MKKAFSFIKQYGFFSFIGYIFFYVKKLLIPVSYKNNINFKKISFKPTYARILCITGEIKNANTYYRCEIPKKLLESKKIYIDIIHEDLAYKSLKYVKYYNQIWFYRTGYNKTNARILDIAKFNKIKTIFSIDDLLFDRETLVKFGLDKYAKNREQFLNRADNLLKLLRMCDYGLVSTNTLKKEVGKYLKQVYVIRNSYIDEFNQFKKIYNKDQKDLKLGYFSGSKSHLDDFLLIWDSLKNFLKKHQNVNLIITGFLDFKIPKDLKRQIKFIPYTFNRRKYMQNLSKIDINLLPLRNTLFNNSKSEIKFIEASLLKIPTLISRTEEFPNVISEDLELLFSDINEFELHLNELLDMNIRMRRGKQAHDFVKKYYNPAIIKEKWYEFVYNLIK